MNKKTSPSLEAKPSDAASGIEDLLRSETVFKLSPERWDAFCAALEAPANPSAALRKLMSKPSRLETELD